VGLALCTESVDRWLLVSRETGISRDLTHTVEVFVNNTTNSTNTIWLLVPELAAGSVCYASDMVNYKDGHKHIDV
jgi:hypothetical protein